ncbi:MAG TPA: lipid A biosynthesis lauroyl acyltransferase, partial [Paraburkholderia sp.]
MKQFVFWLMVGLLRTLSVLPYGWVARAGSALGAFLYCIPSRRKRIVLTNLNLCFPEKNQSDRNGLARAHF